MSRVVDQYWADETEMREMFADQKKRIKRLEGVMDWIERVASDPGQDKRMALRRIADEAHRALGR